jgi:hypothetical protein
MFSTLCLVLSRSQADLNTCGYFYLAQRRRLGAACLSGIEQHDLAPEHARWLDKCIAIDAGSVVLPMHANLTSHQVTERRRPALIAAKFAQLSLICPRGSTNL